MESCPHCNFLVRDGARTCGVCHRPVTADASASDLGGAVAGTRVAPAAGGASVAVVALMMLLILFGAGAGLAAAHWT